MAGAPRFYEWVAPLYDRIHRTWLHFAGADALAAVEGGMASALPHAARVLDAGCGTGGLARRLQQIDPGLALTLCDASPAMLARTGGIAAARQLADVRRLPFADAAFDAVVCTWVLETLPGGTAQAMAELLRVLKPGGLLGVAISSRPLSPAVRLRMGWLMAVTRWIGAGRFLDPAAIAALAAPGARLLRFHNGLSTVVLLRKPVS
jgi:ubiquinone/menaquinone biosynthesis C-methylase UbiE